MKKYLILLLLAVVAPALKAQESDEAVLTKISSGQTVTATTRSAARLFADKDDLTSVIYILTVGSSVEVIGLDSTYYHVMSEGNEGYIKKSQAIIDVTPKIAAETGSPETTAVSQETDQASSTGVAAQTATTSRLADLQARYDTKTAQSIFERKIWKGMNTDMVIDSWGNPQKINRTIVPDSVTEEWLYTSTWLYFEDDILVSWGPIEK